MSKVGTVEQMLRDEETGIVDFTESGQCSGCGNCCANFLPVSDVEIKRIRQYIRKHGVKEQLRRFPTAKPMVDMMCPFRDELEKKCLIYEVRPAICRDFLCSKPRKEMETNKMLYHKKYGPKDMRLVFFGRKTDLF